MADRETAENRNAKQHSCGRAFIRTHLQAQYFEQILGTLWNRRPLVDCYLFEDESKTARQRSMCQGLSWNGGISAGLTVEPELAGCEAGPLPRPAMIFQPLCRHVSTNIAAATVSVTFPVKRFDE